jgi:hypothetical protein
MIKRIWNKFVKSDETGQALILVLILLVVGALIITPLLANIGTGVQAGELHEEKAIELYAADAGIEDALWQIDNENLSDLFALHTPSYDEYDFVTDDWTYLLPEQVNGRSVNVTIKNMWIPEGFLATPDKDEARDIIETGKLLMSGTVTSAGHYRIKITYYSLATENLLVETLGIWLPPGFHYQLGSSNLEQDILQPYYKVPTVTTHASGEAVVWDYSGSPVPFTDFPGVDTAATPLQTEITFEFTPSTSTNCDAVSWMTTSGVASIPYTWDADVRVYRAKSIAGDTTIEGYAVKTQLRQLASAITGDYRAIGNSLLIDANHDGRIRETLLSESTATASDIPPDAEVAVAYLYWSGWYRESAKPTIFSDTCSNFNNWNRASTTSWAISSGRFRGHYSSGGDSARYLTLKNSLNLTPYTSGKVEVRWDQSGGGTLEGADALKFQFSGDGGTTWSNLITAFQDDLSSTVTYRYTIPAIYLTSNFKIRYYLEGFADSSEYCYIDNIYVTAMPPDMTATLKIDGVQVYFDGSGNPQQGAQPLTADSAQVINNTDYGDPHGYSYASKKDVTALILAFAQKDDGEVGNDGDPSDDTYHPGNAAYTVGSVDATWNANDEWAYAGWSLIIIYSSPETTGHQLYLYDTFLYKDHNDEFLDFDQNGTEGGTISGFLVPESVPGEVIAAKMTCFIGEGDQVYSGDYLRFNNTKLPDNDNDQGLGGTNLNNVWNSQSIGMSADGVDVDTFYVRWDDNLLLPGDTSAQIDIWTEIDIWNLVYIILSFRSVTTSGGAVTYLIQ